MGVKGLRPEVQLFHIFFYGLPPLVYNMCIYWKITNQYMWISQTYNRDRDCKIIMLCCKERKTVNLSLYCVWEKGKILSSVTTQKWDYNCLFSCVPQITELPQIHTSIAMILLLFSHKTFSCSRWEIFSIFVILLSCKNSFFNFLQPLRPEIAWKVEIQNNNNSTIITIS